MSSTTLTGQDVVIINGTVFTDVADGDWASIEFPNELAQIKAGKNGNYLYALNNSGKICNVTLRVPIGGALDKFLNNILVTMEADFSAFNLMTGSFSKRVGDGAGNVVAKEYDMNGGIIKKHPGAKANAEGTPEQSVTVWDLQFANAPASIA
jgi:hypothetical protein